MAFLWLPATTWADADEHSDHNSGQVDGSDDEVWDGEQEGDYGSIVPSDIQLTYKIKSQPTGTYGDSNYVDGTVELEGIYYVPTGVGQYSLSIPHEIQVVSVNMTNFTAEVALYTVTGIAQGAFYGNTSLTSVTIPYTVQYIGTNSTNTNGAFRGCTNLTSVAFVSTTENPSQLTAINNYAFYDCSSLVSIDLPASVTTLGDDAFMGCTALTSIELPEKVTSIGGSLFRNCTALKEAKLPESLTVINGSCFRACSALTTVWMSGSATISSHAFAKCPSLSAFVLEGSEPAETGGSEAGDDPFLDDEGEVITLYVPTGSAPAYLKTKWVDDFSDTDETLQWNFLTYSNGINSLSCDDEGTYYATYYTDAVGEFGSDVTPYIVTDVKSGEVTTQKLDGYIPGGTGVLLTASASGDTYYYHPYGVTDTDATTVTGNMLYGSLTETTTVGGNGSDDDYYFYKLTLNSSNEEGTVGFYWGAEEGGAFSSAAYKAWLAVPKADATGLSYFSFKNDEGDTTGISSIETASEKVVKGIYTLQGVRVSDMSQKGVYIVDGKKVLVK